MELVAFLGSDKENWGQIVALINRAEWDKIILVKNKYLKSPTEKARPKFSLIFCFTME